MSVCKCYKINDMIQSHGIHPNGKTTINIAVVDAVVVEVTECLVIVNSTK